jgi:hypothetical protein
VSASKRGRAEHGGVSTSSSAAEWVDENVHTQQQPEKKRTLPNPPIIGELFFFDYGWVF